MAKTLVCPEPGRLEWVDSPDPALAEDSVCVRSRNSAAKHGTEMAFYQGYANPRGTWNRVLSLFDGKSSDAGYPFPVGNMFVGEIVAAGSAVKDLSVGDMVFGHGPFRDYHTLAADRCWKLISGLSWQSAVCIDPAEFALGSVRDSLVRVGDLATVFGLGAIGLMAVQIARIAGAAVVYGVDPVASRREAAERLGADATFDPTERSPGLAIKEATQGRGTDICIDFAGHRDSLQEALRAVAFGGNVVYGAFPAPFGAGLDLGAESHLNRPNLIFSRANSSPDREHPRWDNRRVRHVCYDLLCSGRLTGDDIVQPVVAFDSLAEEYPKIATEPSVYLKLGAAHPQ